jgi:hypothetical protein
MKLKLAKFGVGIIGGLMLFATVQAAPATQPASAVFLGNDGFVIAGIADPYKPKLSPEFCPANGRWNKGFTRIGCEDENNDAAPTLTPQQVLDRQFGVSKATVVGIGPNVWPSATIYYRINR